MSVIKRGISEGDERFQRPVKVMVDRFGYGYMADNLKVSIPTIKRWYAGISVPVPFMKEQIFEAMEEMKVKVGNADT